METVEIIRKAETVDQVKVFKALSDETRLKIIELLSTKGELCVCFIYEELKMSQPRISRHLGILKESGILFTRPEGSWVYYNINMKKLADVSQGLNELSKRCHNLRSAMHCE